MALRRQVGFEDQIRTFESQAGTQSELVEKLKDGLNKMRSRREELVQKRDELVSRAKMAQAQIQVQDAVRSVSVMDPTSELNRFEERIRRQESLARGREEVAASSLDAQFEQLEAGADDLEVEERLRLLKSGGPAGQLTAGSGSASSSTEGTSAG